MAEDEVEDVKELSVEAIIGFDGGNTNSLVTHPDGKHIVYALGNKVAIMEWATKKQQFLVGHTNIVSCVALSRSGKFIASGQINHIGFRAKMIVWDFEKKEILSEHEHHKVRVEALVFSSNDKYVISLGGRDCGSAVVWDTEAHQVICGNQVAKGVAGEVSFVNSMTTRAPCFLTVGDNHLAVWVINHKARSMVEFNLKMTKLKRYILCAEINERDEVCFCGTTTGDVLKVRLYFHNDIDILEPTKQPSIIGCFAKISKKKLPRGVVDLYQNGIRAIKLLVGGKLVIGDGDGNIELVEEFIKPNHKFDVNIKMPSIPALKVHKATHVNSAVSAIQLMDEENILVGTHNSEIFTINLTEFKARLVVTCHTSTIHDIAFPQNYSEVFATAGSHDIRVWSMRTMQEFLRIRVQNFTCSSVVFSYDGKSILSGWSDGVIRSFTPLTGRLIFAILNAHNKGVSALTTTSHGKTLISGGCEGQVRLWEISPFKQQLTCTLKEHKGPVSAIDVNKFDNEAASASTDGTVIIWDLQRQRRRQILFANTLFMCVRYFPSGVQILTGGSDRKLSYWEVLDGSLVRELEGSPTGTINTLDISPDGEYFVSGGNDQIIKLWTYQEGITTHIGVGHTGVITASCFSADGKYLVTCDASGCIFIWNMPLKLGKVISDDKVSVTKKITTPSRRSVKGEEDIRDLPSVRSSKSNGSHRVICECDKESKPSSRCSGISLVSCR
ncbi:cilia- and flagella-associated protein 52 [Diorhabda carinulata]|uniref:cilia- and flagella-associated protein 52 n=1 Tax=Diorhabda carinulata TaxID=1163345 RepID=UPI0025A0DED7|nr:cilia- and flagella-associated protein 52 [Diorhabda carinulata]